MRTRSRSYPSAVRDARENCTLKRRQMTTGEEMNGKGFPREPNGAPSVRTFDDFPDDLLIYVLARVSSRAECPADFFNVLLTCKRFYYLGLHPPVLSTASTGALAAKASSWSSGAHKFRKQCADAGNTNAYGFQSLEFACLRASTSKITSCDFSSDGKLLANAGHEKKVVVWNLDSLKVKSILEEHSFLVTDVRFSTDSMHLATSSFDRTVKVWDVDNPKYSLCTFTGHLGTVMSLDFHPSNEDLVCSCDGESEIRYWSVSQGVCTRKFKGGTSQVRFQPCLGLFLAAADENVVRTFDVETGSCLHSLRGHIKPVHSVCWDASGNYLASVSEDSVRVWNVGSRGDECVQMLTCIEDKFHSCVYHPEYHSVLVIGCSKTLELWNVAENRSMTIPAHKGLITALAASEVTGIVVSASHDKTLKLWK